MATFGCEPLSTDWRAHRGNMLTQIQSCLWDSRAKRAPRRAAGGFRRLIGIHSVACLVWKSPLRFHLNRLTGGPRKCSSTGILSKLWGRKRCTPSLVTLVPRYKTSLHHLPKVTKLSCTTTHSSVSDYLGSPIWCAGCFPLQVDGCAPQTQHVNLRIV